MRTVFGHQIMHRRAFGFQTPCLFKPFNDLFDILTLRDRRNECRVSCGNNRCVLQANGREQPAFAAQICPFAVDSHNIADDDVALVICWTHLKQRLP